MIREEESNDDEKESKEMPNGNEIVSCGEENVNEQQSAIDHDANNDIHNSATDSQHLTEAILKAPICDSSKLGIFRAVHRRNSSPSVHFVPPRSQRTPCPLQQPITSDGELLRL